MSFPRYKNQLKALVTMNQISEWLGIPPEMLKGSTIKVDASVEPNEKIWYEAYHDGMSWDLIRETERFYMSETHEPDREEFIHLEEDAVHWLIAQCQEAEGKENNGDGKPVTQL